MTVCGHCHKEETKTFALRRHGIRRHPKLAEPRDPRRRLENVGLGGGLPEALTQWIADSPLQARMTVAEARLPMRANAAHRSLDCGACHRPHAVDIEQAAVEACASCHDDPHSRAYSCSSHTRRGAPNCPGIRRREQA